MNGPQKQCRSQMPGAAAHVFAVFCALLLSLFIFLGSCMLLLTNLLTNREMHYQTALSPDIVDAQMNVIAQRIKYIAEDNKLKEEDLMPSRESVQNYGLRIVDWWMGLIGQKPDLNIPIYTPDYNAEIAEAASEDTAGQIADIVQHAVFPLRRELIEIGLPLVMKYADLYDYSRYLPYIAAALWLLGLFAAGLIALLLSRRMFVSLQYIGGALGAAGLLVGCIPLFIKWIGLEPWLAQANPVLLSQYSMLTQMIVLWTVILGIILLIAGLMCIGVYRKKMRALELKGDPGGPTD